MVKALLGIENGTRSVDERKYKIKEQLEAKNEIFGNTPLHVAASVGNTEAVETILSVLHDPKHLISKKNKLKDTPVHNAASKGHVRLVRMVHTIILINYECMIITSREWDRFTRS